MKSHVVHLLYEAQGHVEPGRGRFDLGRTEDISASILQYVAHKVLDLGLHHRLVVGWMSGNTRDVHLRSVAQYRRALHSDTSGMHRLYCFCIGIV
jgi:hypothetical protein